MNNNTNTDEWPDQDENSSVQFTYEQADEQLALIISGKFTGVVESEKIITAFEYQILTYLQTDNPDYKQILKLKLKVLEMKMHWQSSEKNYLNQYSMCMKIIETLHRLDNSIGDVVNEKDKKSDEKLLKTIIEKLREMK